MLYALVIAGVPGRISNAIKRRLAEKYNHNVVLRVPGAPLRNDEKALYSDKLVGQVVDNMADAVFGKSKRPLGFCRNGGNSCSLHHGAKSNCGATEHDSCALSKPNFLIVLFQEGLQEDVLKKTLHHAAYTANLPKACYNKEQETFKSVESAFQEAKSKLGQTKRHLESSKSPLLLPPDNFGVRDLKKILAHPESLTDTDVVRFKREFFRDRAFHSTRSLSFTPADSGTRHGVPSVQDKPEIALTRHFRLGAQYAPNIHYDVSREDDRHFDGGIKFNCRIDGALWPKTTHVNVTVDDCILK